uniref:Uncharacterized protein n=1 Tax=Panagrolaimus sp. PS1159 TaxID=55785 RepID=A0AC35GVA7_9BILA
MWPQEEYIHNGNDLFEFLIPIQPPRRRLSTKLLLIVSAIPIALCLAFYYEFCPGSNLKVSVPFAFYVSTIVFIFGL